jgi:AraC family transcriptional regulator
MEYVRDHAFDALTLQTVARIAGLSPYHFTRQFSARYGLTPMAQVRELRMAVAARQLADGTAPTLVELALLCGFESQEGFTRAFKRAFGVSPGRYRQKEDSRNDASPTMPQQCSHAGLIVLSELERKSGFKIAGFGRRFEESSRDQIPALWGRLTPRLPFAGQVGNATYGVCWEADDGTFQYMAGAALAPGSANPKGVQVRSVPAQTCLVFRLELSDRPLVSQMQEAAREIWGWRLPQSGHTLARGPDVEFYPDDFRPGRPGKFVEWWIPVKS